MTAHGVGVATPNGLLVEWDPVPLRLRQFDCSSSQEVEECVVLLGLRWARLRQLMPEEEPHRLSVEDVPLLLPLSRRQKKFRFSLIGLVTYRLGVLP